jgi:hypothetical protein
MFGESAVSGMLRGVDVSEPKTAGEKATGLVSAEVKSVEQAKQLENPDAAIVLDTGDEHPLINSIATPFKGLGTGDDPRYRRKYFEVPFSAKSIDWITFRSAPEKCHPRGAGFTDILYWQRGNGDLANSPTAYIRNTNIWAKEGLLFGMMRNLPSTIYSGSAWDTTSCCLIPNDNDYLTPLWCFAESGELQISLRKFNQKLSVEVNHFGQVPFDLDHWTRVAQEKYPNGLPEPYSDDPTQWIFHGHPCGSVIWNTTTKLTDHAPTLRIDDTVLHIATARLLGYRWPAELDPDMELAPQQREWVHRTTSLNAHADEDGIVCIPSVRGEAAAEDRLLNLLADAYGSQWSNTVLDQLLAASSHAGKSLETWLRDKFFTQHCKLFGHRPFIWHIWDGLNDGFSALVNYHKLDYKTLETLIYTYLGDWISRQQENDRKAGLDSDGEKTTAAKKLKEKLELILEGESPYDIFVRWKPLGQQPIGWNPDLNDGVRLNIRPFVSVPPVKKKDAGVLRDKPNIKWGKDRGKDVETALWFHKFGGDRINDHHLTLEEKRTF